MAEKRTNGNTDSGIESDPEGENSVLLVVDIGDSVITSRDDRNDCSTLSSSIVSSEESPLNEEPMDVTTSDDQKTTLDDTLEEKSFQLRLSSEETLTVSMETFCEYETRCLPEFFDGLSKGKSSESYLKIRNHFINHWTSVRPKRFGYHEMLRKVGYLHLGNVTAFSRVQKFLESHRVINEGALKRSELSKQNRRENGVKRVSKEKKTYSENQKKKLGLNDDNVKLSPRTRPNPFKLVPLETFDDETQAPFAVRLSMEALAIIDIHAHCVRTEVIGLLGGRFCPQTRELRIMTSEPCASLDDHDLQCDMEPVSQADAKEALEQKAYQVVGWYHSHPTFVPNPSLRDLETQHNFQQLFSHERRPFVALILSPYCWSSSSSSSSSLVSQFKCLWLSDHVTSEYRVPYELAPKIIRTDKLVFHVTSKLTDLMTKIKGHASRLPMNERVKRFRQGQTEVTHLDKLCSSLRHYLWETGLSLVECEHLLEQCKQIVCRDLLK